MMNPYFILRFHFVSKLFSSNKEKEKKRQFLFKDFDFLFGSSFRLIKQDPGDLDLKAIRLSS